jgi:predicted acyltransferase
MSVPRDVSPAAAGSEVARPARILSIDRFRGALVVLMVVANYLSGVSAVPAFLKHTPDIGLTIVDIGAPCFVFAMGLTYGPSFHRRAERGLPAAYRHFLLRYLAFVGIGAIVTSGGTQMAAQPSDWGVLQALGVAGLVCLPFIRLGTTLRFVIGAALLSGYQVLLDATALDAVRASVQGGVVGGLSWGALLILSTAVADVWRRGRTRAMLLCCAALWLVALLTVVIVPVSKTRVSLSYMLVSLAIGALGFLLVDLLSRVLPARAGFFAWWGENALLLYLLHLPLLGLVEFAGTGWYADAPLWLVAVQLMTILGVLSAVAWWLHRRGIRFAM